MKDEEFDNVVEGPVSELVCDDGENLVTRIDAADGSRAPTAGQQSVIEHHARTRPEAVQVRVHLRRICTINQSIDVKFVGRRYTTRPGAPTVVSGKHDHKVHS